MNANRTPSITRISPEQDAPSGGQFTVRWFVVGLGLALFVLAAACSPSGAEEILVSVAGGQSEAAVLTPTVVPAPTVAPPPTATPFPTSTPLPTVTPFPTPTPLPTTVPTSTPIPRILSEQELVPMATIGDVLLHHPARIVERIGFHEAGHTGARQMDLLGVSTQNNVMESRGRETGTHTAADVVVDPGEPIYSPISGLVISAGTYVLYCEHEDNYVIIEPDGRPGWQAKVFHIEGLTIADGDQLVAGETQIAERARLLPFVSQVDEFTAEPSWPHVHVEVVDTSIPDERTGGGC